MGKPQILLFAICLVFFTATTLHSQEEPQDEAIEVTAQPEEAVSEEAAVIEGEVELEYLLLATKKTGTMQKEIREAAEAGYRFKYAMGGGTSFGGSEVVIIMSRPFDQGDTARYEYILLATSKTGTMQKEIREAAENGYEYSGQTVFSTSFGGSEVLVILERDIDNFTPDEHDYLLLASKKTSTMQKELREASEQGYSLVGLTVSKSRFGGSELICIMRRPKDED